MTLHLPSRLNLAGSVPLATFVSPQAVNMYEKDPNYTCTEHWIFNKGSSAGLKGIKSGGMLTDAGAAKTWNANSVTIAGTLGSRLNTAHADRLKFTQCGVIKVPATGGGSGVGTPLFSTREGATTGGSTFCVQGGTSVDMISRAIISGASTQQSSNTTNFTVGEYRFFAYVVDHSGANRLRRHSLGNVHFDYTDSAAFTVAPTNLMGIGPTANDQNTPAAIEHLEYILWLDVALTTAQIEAVYLRSQDRMRVLSGVTVV